MLRVRPPAVAGVFYPADPTALRLEVCRLLEQVVPAPCVVTPRALIVPHAGFRYSGPIAASDLPDVHASVAAGAALRSARLASSLHSPYTATPKAPDALLAIAARRG